MSVVSLMHMFSSRIPGDDFAFHRVFEVVGPVTKYGARRTFKRLWRAAIGKIVEIKRIKRRVHYVTVEWPYGFDDE